MKTKAMIATLCLCLLLSGCGANGAKNEGYTNPETPGEAADLGDDGKSFGTPLAELGAYDGYFEGESTDVAVTCVSGTDGAYRLDGETLTFTTVTEETVYAVSGAFRGNIVIDVGNSCKFELELHGLSLVCNSTNPITVISGDEVAIKAKKDTKNYIYDMREAIDEADETLYSGAIHSDVDLEIGGKGALTVISENNNGIHSKDDLQVKNLTLLVACIDNSLKGNDSVEITGGSTTLIASAGDGIKSSNSDISQKGNQRGTISIVGGTHSIYAACDGIDAAYNVVIDDSTTVLNVYTDKYSSYSGTQAARVSLAVGYERGFGGRPGGPGGMGGMGGPGGMGEGNPDKGEYSTKGIKAANEIVIRAGTVNVKSYDDAIHANNDTALENGATSLGNITVNGGNITLYSADDGLHADGALSVSAGTVSVVSSYEGLEGDTVSLSGGYVSVNAKDDGVNATAETGTGVTVSGGTLYICCTGDGIDSNSRTSYQGIVFSGGNTVVISNSNGNSAIDTEQGYAYEGGAVLAIMPRGGMESEATHCRSFSSVGKSTQISLTKDSYLVAEIGGGTATVKMPASINALVITLGDSSPSITTETSVSVTLDGNGVAWN